MNSKAYILGFLVGMAVVLLACLALRIYIKRKTNMNRYEYDERQKAIQGTGYKYAYLTLLAVILAGGILEMMLGVTWCSLFVLALLGMWASVCVFITYCVIRDAYFALRSRRRPIMVCLLAAGAINLAIGIFNALEGGIIENGQLSLNFTNLLTGVCCVYLGIMMLARSRWERRQEAEE